MNQTIRQQIISILQEAAFTAKEISGQVSIPEKEVYDHLQHIKKALPHSNMILKITPSQCRQCEFRFTKREKLKKPGKCPICKGSYIEEPLFSIKLK